MPQMLSDMSIDEISLVDDPANESARVLIVKSKNKYKKIEDDEMAPEEEMDTESDDDDEEMENSDKGHPKKMKKANYQSLKESGVMSIENLTKALEDAESRLNELSQRVEQADESLEEANAVIKAKDEEIAKLRGGSEGAGEEDILKSLPESIRKRLVQAEADAKAAAEEVAKMNAAKEEAEAIAKAREIGVGDPEQMGPLLMRVAKGMSTAEDAAALETLLKSIAEVGATSALFKSIGTASASEGDPEVMLKSKAEEIQKGHPGMSFEAAYTKAMEENPSLYSAYITKRRAA